VRAENVRARWPDRLAFDAVCGDVSVAVQTQLCGEHWVGAVLAAIAATLAAGVELREIATALAGIAPTPHRMFPVTRDGVTFVCDDAKAPLWTMPIALAFLADARAPRKVLVVGRMSDYPEHRPAYVSVAKAARAIADHTLFFGLWAWHVERARAGDDDDRIQWFNAFEGAKRRLAQLLRPGDLVLLKGNEDDRMDRFLDAGVPAPDAGAEASATAHEAPRNVIIVGLGNPGERHRGARHSVGHEVVDRLAARHGLEWRQVGGAALARLVRHGATVVLVKLDAQMNDSGPALQRLRPTLALDPVRTILVHDEIRLDPGRIRGRLEGGDGGHLGARSVLSTFESHRFRRVKVGVGAPPPGRSLVDHVLGAFDDNERAAIERALDAACDQALVFVDEILHNGRQAPADAPASSPARAGG
jgi:aminoacyl-tRNA hydrolase